MTFALVKHKFLQNVSFFATIHNFWETELIE